MDRQQHLDWAKKRAYEYLDKDADTANAYASFLSDVRKHPDLNYDTFLLSLGINYTHSVRDMRKFIEGFN